MTIIYGQCNKATKTKITLRRTYDVDCQDGNIIGSLKRVHTVALEAMIEVYLSGLTSKSY